jgi:hypothetical protein
MQRTLALSFLIASAAVAQSNKNELRSYAYISPAAQSSLKGMGVTENELIHFVDSGLGSRSISAIDPHRVYEGSEDALRIDIRKPSDSLIVTLSVQQGVSINNMLQRWRGRESLQFKQKTSPTLMKLELLACLSRLLDSLKSNFNSNKYLHGEMLERQN